MIALATSNLRRVGTMLLYHGVVMLSSVGVGGFVRVGHGLGVLSRVMFVRVYMRIYGFVNDVVCPR